MRVSHFKNLGADIRSEMMGLRWLILDAEDLPNATAAWMFAELDGVLVAVDHRGKPFESNLYNRAIHLLMLDVKQEIPESQKSKPKDRLSPFMVKWAWRDSNPRSTPCKGGVIAARPQAQLGLRVLLLQ